MAISNISAAQYISGRLRKGVADGDLTDYNSGNRPGNFVHWVYPDKPRIAELLKNKNQFPRVSVESMDDSTIKRLGMQSTQYHELVQLSINSWVSPNLTCEISNVATEDHTYVTGTDEYELDNLPISIIGATVDGTMSSVAHIFDRDTDYELIDADHDGFYDSISWLGADEPDNGTTFTCAYNRKAGGEELARIIVKDIHNYIKSNWLTWFEIDKALNYYKVTSSKPIKLDAYEEVYRHELFCTFQGIDIGKSI